MCVAAPPDMTSRPNSPATGIINALLIGSLMWLAVIAAVQALS